MNDLTGQGLVAGRGGTPIVRAANLAITPGRLTFLLGPNGAGKSTLLLTLAGLLAPLSGRAALADLTPRERARRVAFLPQEESAAFPLTVRESAAIGRAGIAAGWRDSAADSGAVERAIEAVGLRGSAEVRLDRLSGGQRRRALIARALAQEAPTLVLDEPTAHLDPAYALEVFALLRRLASEGRTVLAATHDVAQAAEVGDELLILGGGEVAYHGPASEMSPERHLTPHFGVRFERGEGLVARPI